MSEPATDLIGARVQVLPTYTNGFEGLVRYVTGDGDLIIETDERALRLCSFTDCTVKLLIASKTEIQRASERQRLVEHDQVIAVAELVRNKRYNVKGELNAEDRRLFDQLGVAVDDMRLRENRSIHNWQGPRDQPQAVETKQAPCLHERSITIIHNWQEGNDRTPRQHITVGWCEACGAYRRAFDGKEVGGGEPQWHLPQKVEDETPLDLRSTMRPNGAQAGFADYIHAFKRINSFKGMGEPLDFEYQAGPILIADRVETMVKEHIEMRMQLDQMLPPSKGSWGIEFRNGSYFQKLWSSNGGPFATAHHFPTEKAANEFMARHSWMMINGAMAKKP